jgi:2-methylcitrate dehydratase PrpD
MKLLSDWLDSVTEFDEIAKSMIEKLREHILDFVYIYRLFIL